MDLPGVTSVGIIGATSPLGICLVDLLSKQRYNVRAGYRLHQHVPASWCERQSIVCVRADLEEPESLKAAFHGCEVIIWLAHLQQNRLDEKEIERNVRPFEWFCGRLSQFGVTKLVFISSGGSIYGEPTVLPIPEDHPRHPLSSYGKAKKHMEDTLRVYGDRTGFATAILRPGNIYGPEWLSERAQGVIGAFFRGLCLRHPLTLIGNGSTVRDFVHGYDVAQAILCAMRSTQRRITWNVGTGIGYSVADILRLICHATGDMEPHVIRQPARSTDIATNILSIKKIKMECGWEPEIGIAQGIEALAKL